MIIRARHSHNLIPSLPSPCGGLAQHNAYAEEYYIIRSIALNKDVL